MPHADSPTCSTGLIQTHRGWWQRRLDCPPSFSLSLLASPGGPPTHTAAAPTNRSSSPYLSSELLNWEVSLLYSFLSLFFSSPSDLCLRLASSPLWWGVMFTLLLHRLCCRPGQASCCSSNSVMLSGDAGRIKLVIFQAWSVLGRYTIRECFFFFLKKESGKRK